MPSEVTVSAFSSTRISSPRRSLRSASRSARSPLRCRSASRSSPFTPSDRDAERSDRLGFFKYTNFFAETVTSLGIPIGPFAIALPLGISFFTFHHIMYLVDLRKGKAPEYPLDRYALYIAFFPQAIAGPLARWSEVVHQYGRQVYVPGWQRQFALGVTFIVIGLVEKVFIADPIGAVVNPIFEQATKGPVTGGQSWLALGF